MTSILLPPELVAQVRGLTADQKDRLIALLEDESGPPAGPDMDEVRRRSDDLHAGRATLLTPEQVAENVRATLRRYGMTL